VLSVARDFASASLLLRLPGSTPLPAFGAVEDVPLIARTARRGREEVRSSLGLGAGVRRVVLLTFGGQSSDGLTLRAEALPPGWACVACVSACPAGGGALPPGYVAAPASAHIPDLVAASDVVIGKIGYGTVSESLAACTPLLFVSRAAFAEEPYLRGLLERAGCGREMPRDDLYAGRWAGHLQAATELKPIPPARTDGAAVIAARLLELARGDGAAPAPVAATAVSDALAWGFRLGSSAPPPPPSEDEAAGAGPSASAAATAAAAVAGWRVLSGNPAPLGELPDAAAFVALLGRLASRAGAGGAPAAASSAGSDDPPAAELDAAAALFRRGPCLPRCSPPHQPRTVCCRRRRCHQSLLLYLRLAPPIPHLVGAPRRRWGAPLCVARAPGRLDVMGGIADYSGSLVLQLPLSVACLAAAQLAPPAAGAAPRLRIVSLRADAARSAVFEAPLADLFPGGAPLPYDAARAYFGADARTAWAAYVGGCLLVLAAERGVAFGAANVSVLISSDVPEGKGVSSSAAVEVAAMGALLAAAGGAPLAGRELALLCQRVENRVVGAPCGIMDQMASALGARGALMPLLCRPAEAQPPLALPAGLAFWGVDSGLRHSVGGADYGSVRAGAFMGRAIVRSLAAADAAATAAGAGAPGAAGPAGRDVRLEHLTQLAPSAFAQRYATRLPEALTGAAFLAAHPAGHGDDGVTAIDPARTYAVRAPAAHPIAEHHRVRAFAELLRSGAATPEARGLLGELMLQSHQSYSSVGLGSAGTDRLVGLVAAHIAAAEAAGVEPSLYGAKISGGGGGGTVVIAGAAGPAAEAAVAAVAAAYAESSAAAAGAGGGGTAPVVFAGSSMGAAAFGALTLSLAA